jgi:hypothetical protein
MVLLDRKHSLATGVQTAAAVHISGSAPLFVSSRHIRVALGAVTGEIAASSQDTTSWLLAAPWGVGVKEDRQSGKCHTLKNEKNGPRY